MAARAAGVILWIAWVKEEDGGIMIVFVVRDGGRG
jgi:hypothetical protein